MCCQHDDFGKYSAKTDNLIFVETSVEKIGDDADSAKINHASTLSLAEFLNLRWQELCGRYLPVSSKDEIWRYNRFIEPTHPEQGWKLHISATILTASDILEMVAPFLENNDAYYKAPVSLQKLRKINSGIYYDYSQIGKFITIYPQSDEQAVYFAEQIHQLTCTTDAPVIPYDLRFKPQSCVYYRYGAFKINKITDADGMTVLTLRDPQGNQIPDLRDAGKAYPDWTSNPFPREPVVSAAPDSPLKNDFKVFRALRQRGKGGVYQALDLSSAGARFCLVKEGRKCGEVEWDGRDGYWRVRNEERVLKALRAENIEVPEIYSSFEAKKNYYLVTEFIAGETLHNFLRKRKKRLSVSKAIKCALQLARIISKIHEAGWLWRDFKPDNIIVTKKGDFRPVDFEGACPINQPDPVPWSTLMVNSKFWAEKTFNQTSLATDLFALGTLIYLLFEGEFPDATEDFTPKILRRNVPSEIKQLVSELLESKPEKCMQAQRVVRKLKAIEKSLSKKAGN